jgi:hypothetical protein
VRLFSLSILTDKIVLWFRVVLLHQLVSWCQYNVTSRPQYASVCGRKAITKPTNQSRESGDGTRVHIADQSTVTPSLSYSLHCCDYATI